MKLVYKAGTFDPYGSNFSIHRMQYRFVCQKRHSAWPFVYFTLRYFVFPLFVYHVFKIDFSQWVVSTDHRSYALTIRAYRYCLCDHIYQNLIRISGSGQAFYLLIHLKIIRKSRINGIRIVEWIATGFLNHIAQDIFIEHQ